jgi:type VI secretion system protein ImpA
VAVHLTRAVLDTDNLPGFCDGLGLIRGLAERYWEEVHPQLDPEDDNDPTFRINTIASLTDPDTTLCALRETPLVRSRSVGQFSLHDIDIAHGDAPPRPDEDEPPQLVNIEAAFLDCELDDLQANADAAARAIEHAKAIEQSVTERVGAANATSLEQLVELLSRMKKIYAEQLVRRGVGVESGDAEAVEEGEAEATARQQNSRLTGEVTSREDVIRALDKVCDYYERQEPSSPLPLLLRRAQRLATKSFLEIVRDLTPEGLSQAEAIGGIEKTEESED